MTEQEKQREQLNRAHNVFRQAVAQGRVGAVDRFNKEIQVGDLLMLRTDVDLLFTVVEVGPSLDRNLPPGIMKVKLTTTFDLNTQAGVPYRPAHVFGRQAPVAAPGPDGNNGQPADPAEPEKATSNVVAFTPNPDEPPE